MKSLSLLLLLLPFASSICAQEQPIPKELNKKIANEFSTLINSKLYSTKNITVTSADGNKAYKSLRDLEVELKKGVDYYKKGQYQKAHPIISELSQWGLKSAQSLLGTMYIKGQHVKPSVERGLAWLGVSNELGGDKSSNANFNYVYKQLNDVQKKAIDQKVQGYVAMFGADAQHITCKKRKEIGSNISVKSCLKTPGSNSTLHPVE
jgi:TPR repeat protein